MSEINWRAEFSHPKFEDSPEFADDFLLPRLSQGDNVYLVSSFAPSYLLRILENLAQNPNKYSGFLNVVFFIQGDLDLRSVGIVRFQQHLLANYQHELAVEAFVHSSITVLSRAYVESFGSRLRISILHTSQKAALVKGCLGVVTSSNSDDEDFVTFVDSKSGDFNSPIVLLKSWDDYDFIEAQGLLGKVMVASNGEHPRGTLVSAEEVNTWLVYLAEWYEAHPPKPPVSEVEDDDSEVGDDDELDDDELDDDELDDEEVDRDLFSYLKSIGEFDDEEKYGWFEESDTDYEDYIGAFAGFVVVVDSSRAVGGHIPPLGVVEGDFYGPARATCVCGRRFFVAQGCPDGSW